MKWFQKIDDNDAISFLETIRQKYINDDQAIILLELTIGQHLLNLNEVDKVVKILKESKKKIEKKHDIHSFLYSSIHKLYANYHRKRKEYDELYNHLLQFLAYTPETVSFIVVDYIILHI